MKEIPPFGNRVMVACVFVVALAAMLRLGYLAVCCDWGSTCPKLAVQGDESRPGIAINAPEGGASDFERLAQNIREERSFKALAPFANTEETTADVSPGYAWFVALAPNEAFTRRVQAGMGVFTVLLLFLFARRVFASNWAGYFVGLLAAAHPFWIINVGEIADGTVATFLLAAAFYLGSRGAATGGPLASLLFGLALAALALVRAAYLPFAFLALGWFLFRCRTLRLGWFAGLLALLGFGNGLAPWTVRNLRTFDVPLPIVNSTYAHLWIGTMPGATGGPVDETVLRASLPKERVRELLDDRDQSHRYASLGRDLVEQIIADPAGTLAKRLSAATCFLLGDRWRQRPGFIHRSPGESADRVEDAAELAAPIAFLALVILGVVGWRRSLEAPSECRLVAIALIWLPLPYLLSHGETLSGPRLPWDAVLILFAGEALTAYWNAVRRWKEPRIGS